MCVVTLAISRLSKEIFENRFSQPLKALLHKGIKKDQKYGERGICEENYDWTALPKRGRPGRGVFSLASSLARDEPTFGECLRKLQQPWRWE